MLSCSLPLLLLVLAPQLVASYKPIIIIHGLFDGPSNFRDMLGFINQMGQYGDTDYLRYLFPHYMKSNLYRICYTQLGQDVSICNYWNGVLLPCWNWSPHLSCHPGALGTGSHPYIGRSCGRTYPFLMSSTDPHHRDLYLNSSSYLAPLNAERSSPNATDWRKNFLRIQKLVLIGGPDDGVITPWQSSHFGFYDESENIAAMEQQTVYLQDSFGLKTLKARGSVTTYTMSGVSHTMWHSNFTVYQTCIAKWLT